MTLTLEVSPETAQRIEIAQSQGMNMEALLCRVLELWHTGNAAPLPSLAPLAGKYEGEAWDELLAELRRNRQQDDEQSALGK